MKNTKNMKKILRRKKALAIWDVLSFRSYSGLLFVILVIVFIFSRRLISLWLRNLFVIWCL